ncbi:uncharacterized protein LOC110762180 isoform X1 [Prunus avium]|uniref:Uncharacterized protein LOC110762180 isoform X1 n=2 Tax=Prunus avium TaxID=42229 RepID=A0A6P5SVZ2_PRUAV|nr:uncharacterized protein LOC110762180 isoform X1 [Prunus avium]
MARSQLMENLGFYQTDCESLWSQIKRQEKQIQLKRRWLLGLPTSKSEQKKLERSEFLNNMCLPESFLREDDMFYETVKSSVDTAFGACDIEGGNRVFQDDMNLLDAPYVSGALSSCLDDLTNKGLYLFAVILTGRSVKFEKTRWKMKRVIREFLPKVFGRQDNHDDKMEISKQISQLLNDPQYFQDNFITFSSSRLQSHHAAVRKVLDGLRDLSYETLLAMHRKLKGGRQSLPQLRPKKSGWNRDSLINQVRKTIEKMLSELSIGDELQEPLTKAMAVVGLSLKLIPGFHNSTITEFHQFSPEIKILQDEISRAIWLVKTKIRIPELKNLKTLLDPNAKVSNRSLRTAIRKMLTEYLFDCGDMDTIPKALLETLVVINKNSQSKPHRRITKDEIEAEVECILNVSAQVKQIVWDLSPDHDLDLDFDDAYMEEMEECDDDDDKPNGDDNGNNGRLEKDGLCGSDRSHSNDLFYEAESTAESMPFVCKPPTAETTRNDCYPLLTPNKSVLVEGLEPMFSTQGDSVDSSSIKRGLDGNSIERHEPECNTGMNTENLLHLKPEDTHEKQTTCKNKYLAVQEVCDETSIIAYNLIGRVLEEFAKTEGLDLDWDDTLYLRGDCATQEVVEEKQTLSHENDDGSIIVRVVEEIVPSFPKSALEALRRLVGLL